MQIAKKQKIKDWYQRNEHYISPAALLTGFVWDNLTLRRIDLLYDNMVMLSYLVLGFFCILLLNVRHHSSRGNGKLLNKIAPVLPFFLQFVFGGLFSAFVIFYSRSASIVASWPFLLMLLLLLIGNEIFRQRYQRLTFHVSIYFIALFSYSVFAIPVVSGQMGSVIFVLSGLLSLILIGLVITILRQFLPEKITQSRNMLLASISLIYIGFNILYFTNVIPPIPLSLKEAGIYHKIERQSAGYLVEYEPASWYVPFRDYSRTFHWQPGTPIYSWSAVFAPTKISTEIMHRWSYYDEQSEKWVVDDVLQFAINGGRDGGFRGYTLKYNVRPGKWRVDVITKKGQVLGRSYFEIVKTTELSLLKEEVK